MTRMSLDMELPLGLGMAMAQYPADIERFTALPEEKRNAMVAQARNARTRQEMRDCIDQLLDQ